MKFGISLKPVTPMRDNPSEKSEMVNQILFGEHFIIDEMTEKWAKITTGFDSYQGWVDNKMITEINEHDYKTIDNDLHIVNVPFTQIYNQESKAPIRISIGSVIPFDDIENQTFKINNTTYSINKISVTKIDNSHLKRILRTAELFLNTPYLWGGKNILGIDCSGFIQNVFRINGISLPRDASQQYTIGEKIDFKDIYPGDLLFFKNDNGNVTHVGMYYNNGKIIHSSGDVHVDLITEEGIYSEKLNKITHKNPEAFRLKISRRK